MAVAVTRAQARERGNPKHLEVTSKMAVDTEKAVRLQDSTLQKFKEAKGTETRFSLLPQTLGLRQALKITHLQSCRNPLFASCYEVSRKRKKIW